MDGVSTSKEGCLNLVLRFLRRLQEQQSHADDYDESGSLLKDHDESFDVNEVSVSMKLLYSDI